MVDASLTPLLVICKVLGEDETKLNCHVHHVGASGIWFNC